MNGPTDSGTVLTGTAQPPCKSYPKHISTYAILYEGTALFNTLIGAQAPFIGRSSRFFSVLRLSGPAKSTRGENESRGKKTTPAARAAPENQRCLETLKRASSLNMRRTGRLSTRDFSSDRELRICSSISSIRLSSTAIIVNHILKTSSRR